ncbi:Basigin [Portunus trituberculatus]|uniref:Basigin n=1 Tax=Portunus trituberculatus TaxID=210409 RepID=A0A5B7D6Q8_PORTR|nr:Basigin [Portunus trituberculatus]
MWDKHGHHRSGIKKNAHSSAQDGEPVQESVNSSRLVLSENEAGISNGSLLIDPVLKIDSGNYMCLITQSTIQFNTTTEVRVKDIYAALWPFLGIVAEVIVLCIIIYIHEKRRIKKNFDTSDSDKISEQKVKEENKENEMLSLPGLCSNCTAPQPHDASQSQSQQSVVSSQYPGCSEVGHCSHSRRQSLVSSRME